jgi:hypothetical protein
MVAVGVVAHHLIAFMVQGCHPEKLVPRASTEKPHGLRCAGDKLHMSEEEEV